MRLKREHESNDEKGSFMLRTQFYSDRNSAIYVTNIFLTTVMLAVG